MLLSLNIAADAALHFFRFTSICIKEVKKTIFIITNEKNFPLITIYY